MAADGDSENSDRIFEHIDAGSKQLVPLAKAYFIGEKAGTQSNVIVEQSRARQLFDKVGAIAPEYPPEVLALIFENSSALRQNVDAYITNIDSFGHSYVPAIEIDAPDADDVIRDALRLERHRQKRDPRNAKNEKLLLADDEPSPKEVKETKEQLRRAIRTERARLEVFFDNCSPDMPFAGPEGLRGLTRQDVEVLGYGYWECLRNGLKEVSQFNRIPACSVRLLPVDDEPTPVKIEQRVSLLTTETREASKRFRRYVQCFENSERVVYFKEFGDPRVVSATTGKIYEDEAALKAEEKETGGIPATEILAFKISSVRSPYGIPRWIGTLLSVLGTRQSEEVNFLYFENRSVPPLALLVSGGRLNENTVKRLETYIENEIRGKRNFHKIMILEAESQDASGNSNTGRMKIEIRPLTDAQQKDAHFQQYDERNADKVGQAFRLPRLLRGDVRDFNRSTAEASIDFSEIQVFGPIRQQFDWVMTKVVFPALRVKFHSFKSNAPTVRDPEALSRMIRDLAVANVLTPFEARELSQGVFNVPLQNIREDWTSQPIALTLAEIAKEASEASDADEPDAEEPADPKAEPANDNGSKKPAKGAKKDPKKAKLRAQAKALLKLHKMFSQAEQEASREEFEKMETETIKVPDEIFNSWFVK